MGAVVCLVVVSHSRDLAHGVVELAGQMAPTVQILAAGGQDDGTVGTSYSLIETALIQATSAGRSAVVLTDLGSAVLMTEAVLEMLDDDVGDRIRLAEGPLVEGAVAAAVAAEGGADLSGVLAAVRNAGRIESAPVPVGSDDGTAPVHRTSVEVTNLMGLHARPAAVLARAMAGFEANVTVDGVDAASVLALMALAATRGRRLELTASGPQAAEALAAAVELMEQGFGER